METRRIKLFCVALIASFSLVLTACYEPPAPETYHPFTPYQKALISQLRATGVKVIKQGDRLQIVIPTDRYFRPQTTQLRRSRVNSVQRVAALTKSYMASFKHPMIRVFGYTDNVHTRATRRELSTRYAKVIAAYLWNGGVPLEWIRVKGFGAGKPIASNKTPRAAAYNRRVVVRIG